MVLFSTVLSPFLSLYCDVIVSRTVAVGCCSRGAQSEFFILLMLVAARFEVVVTVAVVLVVVRFVDRIRLGGGDMVVSIVFRARIRFFGTIGVTSSPIAVVIAVVVVSSIIASSTAESMIFLVVDVAALAMPLSMITTGDVFVDVAVPVMAASGESVVSVVVMSLVVSSNAVTMGTFGSGDNDTRLDDEIERLWTVLFG
jgi:hypothetical protein